MGVYGLEIRDLHCQASLNLVPLIWSGIASYSVLKPYLASFSPKGELKLRDHGIYFGLKAAPSALSRKAANDQDRVFGGLGAKGITQRRWLC